jgi:hypothetical protein
VKLGRKEHNLHFCDSKTQVTSQTTFLTVTIQPGLSDVINVLTPELYRYDVTAVDFYDYYSSVHLRHTHTHTHTYVYVDRPSVINTTINSHASELDLAVAGVIKVE